MTLANQDRGARPGEADMRIAASTFGFQFFHSLEATLDRVAALGFAEVDLMPTAPHMEPGGLGPYQRLEFRRALRQRELSICTITPGNIDVNLISLNSGVRELTKRQLSDHIRLAHDLEVSTVVIVPGRQFGLKPIPDAYAVEVLRDGVDFLLAQADRLGVRLLLENTPQGLLNTSDRLLEFVRGYDNCALGIAWDVANAVALEDPIEGFIALADHVEVVHISDCTRDNWVHGRIGTGDIDLAGISATLVERQFAGPTVYELADGTDPGPALAADANRLSALGWPLREQR